MVSYLCSSYSNRSYLDQFFCVTRGSQTNDDRNKIISYLVLGTLLGIYIAREIYMGRTGGKYRIENGRIIDEWGESGRKKAAIKVSIYACILFAGSVLLAKTNICCPKQDSSQLW